MFFNALFKLFQRFIIILGHIIEKHKNLLKSGRIVVRYSGTENILRIMAEGKELKNIKKIAHLLFTQFINTSNTVDSKGLNFKYHNTQALGFSVLFTHSLDGSAIVKAVNDYNSKNQDKIYDIFDAFLSPVYKQRQTSEAFEYGHLTSIIENENDQKFFQNTLEIFENLRKLGIDYVKDTNKTFDDILTELKALTFEDPKLIQSTKDKINNLVNYTNYNNKVVNQ